MLSVFLQRVEPSLVILDLRLGQEDGLNVLREIRSRSDVPVIIVTGHRCEETDRVIGLELGADDYVTKTFQPARAAGAHPGDIAATGTEEYIVPRQDSELGVYTFGGWRFNRRVGRLTNSSETRLR